ncbi:uncharacterized protein EV420DRAFT_1268847 [Desarmillaria tabescens]|uniref:BHLH domain-containing protein n=1 Tax=Armillaria tabescens TaxID=1929756 RepID=A0AA39KH19_ARMTA|nr:uncharacterized protein EV420DRAFT_1268847 [Desarmillaria tabescens]KAK0459609.1 hypothetical protein EV420DRAFT_1268847 [Desarmillaria tabescens]
MDAHIDDQQQKDYLSPFFDLESLQNGGDLGIMSPSVNAQQPQSMMTSATMPSQMDMEMLGNLMSLQGINSPSSISPTSPSHPQFSTNTATTNPQLLMEQQFKLAQLQQLQQLQNQIFQQQVSLSIRADNYGDSVMTPIPSHSISSQFNAPRGSTSAPAHIAFRSSPSHPPHGDIDVDISPLTSPWLGAEQHHSSFSHRQSSSNKRTASSSGDESSSKPSRKKQSPAVRPFSNASSTIMTKRTTNPRGSRSTNSTPLLRSTRSRNGSIISNEVVGDSPSPVDLSMPPPAAPSMNQTSIPDMSAENPPPTITPVTPASIMNLGRLGVGSSNNTLIPKDGSVDLKGKAPSKSSTPAAISQRNKSMKRGSVGSSPALKPILPAGSTTGPASSSAKGAAPVVQVRKTSHKAAEQKRRDSLKTTFDDLRGLLPPIPLPSDEKYPLDEPLLPGALPPRGPPKAGGEGPNKGVSKLQLLICGNDYIRQLKGRVERRDEEIRRLRSEIGRLRDVLTNSTGGVGIMEEGCEPVDLERDLDEIEAISTGLSRGASIGADDEADEDED